jgi:hypothetical protein
MKSILFLIISFSTLAFINYDIEKKVPIHLEVIYPNSLKKIKSIDTVITNYFKRNKFSVIDQSDVESLYYVEYKKIMDKYMNRTVQNERQFIEESMNIAAFCRKVQLNVFTSNLQIDSVNLSFQNEVEHKKKSFLFKSFSNELKMSDRDFLLFILDSCNRAKDFFMDAK